VHRKIFATLALFVAVQWVAADDAFWRYEPGKPIPAEQLPGLLKLVRPQPGEALWMRIDWQTSPAEAQRMAAAENKPIFMYTATGATGIGPC
jgi:hypothetical protein